MNKWNRLVFPFFFYETTIKHHGGIKVKKSFLWTFWTKSMRQLPFLKFYMKNKWHLFFTKHRSGLNYLPKKNGYRLNFTFTDTCGILNTEIKMKIYIHVLYESRISRFSYSWFRAFQNVSSWPNYNTVKICLKFPLNLTTVLFFDNAQKRLQILYLHMRMFQLTLSKTNVFKEIL